MMSLCQLGVHFFASPK